MQRSSNHGFNSKSAALESARASACLPLAEEDATAWPRCQPRHRLLEAAGIATFAVLCSWGLIRLGLALERPAQAWLLAVAALFGWLIADFLSGLAHWALDTWGSVRTPWLGPGFIRPFREHHRDEHAITTHDFIETNGASCLACLPLLIAATLLPLTGDAAVALQSLLLATALGVLATNQCHKWAHTAPKHLSPAVRLAQRLRLVLPPAMHRRHHTPPFDSHYCTASGWLNAPLEAIGFFRCLERAIARLGWAAPARNQQRGAAAEKGAA